MSPKVDFHQLSMASNGGRLRTRDLHKGQRRFLVPMLSLLCSLSANFICLGRIELSLAFSSSSPGLRQTWGGVSWSSRSFRSPSFRASVDSKSADGLPPHKKQTQPRRTDSPLNKSSSSSSLRSNYTNTLSPYHILHPYFFHRDTVSQRRLPLYSCLKVLRQALSSLMESDGALPQAGGWNETCAPWRVLRIEHAISHQVDPLAWLHAQKVQSTLAVTSTTAHRNHDMLYFGNAEETLEAAVYGAAYRHTTATASRSTDMFQWIQQNLPPESLLYGGERFDADSRNVWGEEWNDFGAGLYLLPAVELKRQTMTSEHSPTRKGSRTTIAVHLHRRIEESKWKEAAQRTLHVLRKVTDQISPLVPPTTLPPIITRESSYGPLDGQEIYERGVAAALDEFEKSNSNQNNETLLEKVVLARRMDLTFDRSSVPFSALDILRRWKYGNNEGGHLFYLSPAIVDEHSIASHEQREFFGCSPERLFQIQEGKVQSEALAGTRPRGSTPEADMRLCRDLFDSPKDREENLITGRFIQEVFRELEKEGSIEQWKTDGATRMSEEQAEAQTRVEKPSSTFENGRFFVRRLRHLQHICERFEGALQSDGDALHVAQFLSHKLHPTPAICGFPQRQALEFIRRSETVAFDRGFYSGPFGCFGLDSADVVVAIRSGLLRIPLSSSRPVSHTAPSLSVYAGAGVVPGSTVQGEWTETSYKIGVLSSIFPSAPLTLQGVSSPNMAWANAFMEELVRSGVTHFYVCPGSRSTPLVAALSRTLRANVGVVHAQSIHDERGAGFRALGYGRATGRPAAVITSSGTAVANLYPSIMEAGMDGVPLLLLTADRPYESRATGANQAVDQVKVFSSTYIRWFRDVLPPSDDVPVSLALSDAGHAVNLARTLRGPVHLNIQFRENLAPEGGAIRNDGRVDSITKFNNFRFTDVPGFGRWSLGGGKWSRHLTANDGAFLYDVETQGGHWLGPVIEEIAGLILNSRRGIVVVGNTRSTSDGSRADEVTEVVSNLAQTAGMPIFAGVQSGSLRFQSPAVVPFAEHLLKHADIKENMKPDFVLQIGSPLISTEIPELISAASKLGEQPGGSSFHHILLHPHHPEERADPLFTVTHHISSEVHPFLKSLAERLETLRHGGSDFSSELAPLVCLGRSLRNEMPDIIHQASHATIQKAQSGRSARSLLTEPQVILAIREVQEKTGCPSSLFLSNSMPVRDAEFFLYPFSAECPDKTPSYGHLSAIGVNRGASGIDGVISTAAGFADASEQSTTLLIGDLATLHDVNALHSLSGNRASQTSTRKQPRLTTVVLDNDGGGIFSFLPVAQHGSDVNFEEFFGTPTNSFSLDKAAEAFGLKCRQAWSYTSFVAAYRDSLANGSPSIVEATVVSRDDNVAVHREITSRVISFLDESLKEDEEIPPSLPVKAYRPFRADGRVKTLVLLHGWMGDKSEWDQLGSKLAESLQSEWNILAVDLPGHGESSLYLSSGRQSIQTLLGLGSDGSSGRSDPFCLSVDGMARRVLLTLKEYGVQSIDALAGYSLGGRVSLAMIEMSRTRPSVGVKPAALITNSTQLVLLSSFPGELQPGKVSGYDQRLRARNDGMMSYNIRSIANRILLNSVGEPDSALIWSSFLRRWYGAPLWGNLLSRNSSDVRMMLTKRASALANRGKDLAAVLEFASPGVHSSSAWQAADSSKTLYISGTLDTKYSNIGATWKRVDDTLRFEKIANVGHALLVEAPSAVSSLILNFVTEQKRAHTVEESQTTQTRTVPYKSPISDPSTRSQAVDVERPAQRVHDKRSSIWNQLTIGSIEFQEFSFDFLSGDTRPKGIGWGTSASTKNDQPAERRAGIILQLITSDGSAVGLGEISPLASVHPESLLDVQLELGAIQESMRNMEALFLPKLNAVELLEMKGALGAYIDRFLDALDTGNPSRSVRSGLEMALLSMAAQVVRIPLLHALEEYANEARVEESVSDALLPLNGLHLRGKSGPLPRNSDNEMKINYPSVKVKVGHQNTKTDQAAVVEALHETDSLIRTDANRAWNMDDAIQFASFLKSESISTRLEFIEEPLEKQSDPWSLWHQVAALEKWHIETGVPYALDESLADLAAAYHYEFEGVQEQLMETFGGGPRGCAALVLKPSLLGMELALCLARLAQDDLGIGVVVSSCFDSGVGLAHAAFLAALSDHGAPSRALLFSHGLGTFRVFQEDTLSPPFSSYVTKDGRLQLYSLSRALYGLGLDELRDSFPPKRLLVPPEPTLPSQEQMYSYQSESGGRELSVVVSLPLSFSAEIACTRFSDLPQQTRWTPWLSSVAYLDTGEETEWTLNIRGVQFKWRATSSLLESPYRGIQWESISGVKNVGVVEFLPTSSDSCLMKVRMTIVPPRMIATLFPPGASAFAEDFLQNKLLKWSLEMFRDVVKGDLALERGDVELGDALFGAAEGRANAIEATLSNPLERPASNGIEASGKDGADEAEEASFG